MWHIKQLFISITFALSAIQNWFTNTIFFQNTPGKNLLHDKSFTETLQFLQIQKIKQHIQDPSESTIFENLIKEYDSQLGNAYTAHTKRFTRDGWLSKSIYFHHMNTIRKKKHDSKLIMEIADILRWKPGIKLIEAVIKVKPSTDPNLLQQTSVQVGPSKQNEAFIVVLGSELNKEKYTRIAELKYDKGLKQFSVYLKPIDIDLSNYTTSIDDNANRRAELLMNIYKNGKLYTTHFPIDLWYES